MPAHSKTLDTPFGRLEAERVRREITEAEMARALGLSSQQVWHNWKDRGVPISAAPKIAAKLKWTLDYLWLGRARDARALNAAEAKILDDLDQLLPEDRSQFLSELSKAADRARRYRAAAAVRSL